jgi:hypothetical protein
MSRDGERMIELVNELASRAGHLLTDMVPPAAQVHLLNAQRELITALMLIYEHRVTSPSGRKPGGRAAAPRAVTRRRSSKRVGKIPVD